MPHILIASRSVVLARGNALELEDIPHGQRQATRGTKGVSAKVVRDIQHVLVVRPGDHEAVALNPAVVVRRHEGVDVLITSITADSGAGEGSVSAMSQKDTRIRRERVS